jgi:hypothetical protein
MPYALTVVGSQIQTTSDVYGIITFTYVGLIEVRIAGLYTEVVG